MARTGRDRWFLSREGQVLGTFSAAELAKKAARGEVELDDHVMLVGGQRWSRARDVPVVKAALKVADPDSSIWFVRRADSTVGPLPTREVVMGIRDQKLGSADAIARAADGPFKPIWQVPPFSLAFGKSDDSVVGPSPVHDPDGEPTQPSPPSYDPPSGLDTLPPPGPIPAHVLSVLEVSVTDELSAAIDAYVERLRRELPGLDVDREAAVRVLIAKGLEAVSRA